MSPKLLNFFLYCWFISTFICMVLEGTYFGSTQNSIINQLSVIQAIKAGGIFSIGSATINFFSGLMRILLWDYSFYEGGFTILRYFWLTVLSPGVVWGVFQGLAYIFAQFIPRLGI